MDIKQLLATLLAHADEIQSQDADLLKDVFEAYGFEPVEAEEPDQDPEHEAQESPETEALEQETDVELGEPLGEVKEESAPAEAPVAPEAPVTPDAKAPVDAPVAPTEEVAEKAPEGMEVPPVMDELTQEVPVEEPQEDPLEGVTAELSSLRSEIEALKSLLEKVAVRTPVTEEEAEEEDVKVGAKGKQGMPMPKEPDVQNELVKKLGGYAR